MSDPSGGYTANQLRYGYVIGYVALFLGTWVLGASCEDMARRPSYSPVEEATAGARAVVRSQLRDGSSAEFSSERVTFRGSAQAVCGRVNAKNGFNAYNGPTRYLVADGLTLVEPSQGSETFNAMWRKYC